MEIIEPNMNDNEKNKDADYLDKMPSYSALARALADSYIESPWMKKYVSNIVSNLIVKETIRNEKEISFNFGKKYFQEKSLGAEVFLHQEDFVVTLDYSHHTFLAYLKRIDLSKKPGIYIIFDQDQFYVGQSAVEIFARLKSHTTDSKKESLGERGKVLFFGRTDGSLGKDKLDYLEKTLITILDTGNRTRINDTVGNSSYISDESKAFCNYLLDSVHRIAFISNCNPFVEEELVNVSVAGLDYSTIAGIVPIFELPYWEGADELLSEDEKKKINAILYVEYSWPFLSDGYIITKPIEKPERNNSYFCEERDGLWIDDDPDSDEEIEDFEYRLLKEYWKRENSELLEEIDSDS